LLSYNNHSITPNISKGKKGAIQTLRLDFKKKVDLDKIYWQIASGCYTTLRINTRVYSWKYAWSFLWKGV